jgi:N-acetyl-anhydromuramyl-L-alanine amidase AmpD
MIVKKHMLVDVPFVEATAYDRKSVIKPTLVIVHDTAGPTTHGNCVSFFDSPQCKTSAHLVVELDGSVTQMVPFNRRAFHAGVSAYKGRKDCNQFAIGIEIVNPGKLDRHGRAYFHRDNQPGFDMENLVRKKTKEHGDGVWMSYTPEQIVAVTEICRALIAAYPIEDITAHWAVALPPGRKVDTNPLFPLEEVRKASFAGKAAKPAAEIVKFPVQEPPSVPDNWETEVIPSVTKPRDVAAQGSRSMSWLQRALAFFGFGTVSTSGLLTADNFSLTKGYVNDIASLLRDNATLLLLVGCAGGFLISAVIRHYLMEAHSSGRYSPRGAVAGDSEAP